MLIFGYVIRYLGIAYENIDNGYQKLGTKHHQVARTLGKGYYKTLLTVDIAMLKPFVLSGATLVFMDLIKELPLTLALRPFNFHTLATQTYQFASDEMLAEAAIPSLIIVGISMCLILVLFRTKASSKT
jgi:iron(III) transport system permease protein